MMCMALSGSSGNGAQIQRGRLYQCGANDGFWRRASAASLLSMSEACTHSRLFTEKA